MNLLLQPFKHWGIDLINQLPTILNSNWWIIIAINYTTGWPVVKAVNDVITNTIMTFLIEEIFMHYSPLKELLSDNSMNLKAQVVEYYLQKLTTHHWNTTAYHSWINEKVKNLNSTLSDMLMKYLAGKSMKLWDEYLS